MQRFLVRNRTRGTVVAQGAPLAAGWWARLRGLIGRHSLAPGEGFIIRPCNSTHTFFMGFPIQVLFVDQANRVLRATPPLAPWRLGPIVPGGSYVVELPVGAVEASQTERGDELEWVPCQWADPESLS